MNADAFNASVRSAYHFLKECQLVRSFTAFKSHNPSGRFRELSLTVDSLYRDLFLCGLRNGDYNLLLSDYAYFQFTHFDKLHYRLAYYPNPFLGMDNAEARELDKAVSEGVLSFEDYSHFLSDQRYEVTVPVIRFRTGLQCLRAARSPRSTFPRGHARGESVAGFSLSYAKGFHIVDRQTLLLLCLDILRHAQARRRWVQKPF